MLELLNDVLSHFKPGRTAESGSEDHQHALQVATAALLIEVVRADGDVSGPELDAVVAALQTRFVLTPPELDALVALARHRSEHAHDLFTFTERLNQSLDERERVRVFETLWRVAYADGRADAHEAHLLRRIADLLHLRQADAIGAKLRAESGR